MTTAVPRGEEPPARGPAAAQIARAATHLREASALVDRLLADPQTGPADQLRYHLGEASRAIHGGLLALTECAEDSGPS